MTEGAETLTALKRKELLVKEVEPVARWQVQIERSWAIATSVTGTMQNLTDSNPRLTTDIREYVQHGVSSECETPCWFS